MNKISVLAHSYEFRKILKNISNNNGTFTSESAGVDGRTLGRMVRKKIISITGFDRKHQRKIYKISVQQIANIIGEQNDQAG